MESLTGFQRDILFVAAGLSTPSGSQILDHLDDYYDKAVTHGHLYPNLDTLVEEGYLDKQSVSGRTNAYVLTAHAERALTQRRTWVMGMLAEAPTSSESD